MPTTKVFYDFSELSEAQQKAYYDKFPDKFSPDYNWYEAIDMNVREALRMVGFSDVKVAFSGFGSQGDGAHFTGDYDYKKGALAKVKKEFPEWVALHDLAKALEKLSKKESYAISFTIKHSGFYCHENCTVFNFRDSRDMFGWTSESFEEKEWTKPCRAFMQEIYSVLQKEYDYLSSWEYVKEQPHAFDHIQICEDTLGELKL